MSPELIRHLAELRAKYASEVEDEIACLRERIQRGALSARDSQANVQHLITLASRGEQLPDRLLVVIRNNCALCREISGWHCAECVF